MEIIKRNEIDKMSEYLGGGIWYQHPSIVIDAFLTRHRLAAIVKDMQWIHFNSVR